MQTVHATTVALDGTGVLLRGPAGSGKSDLALRLIDQGARLVADDRTALALEGGRIIARAPETIAGRIEVRGLGIIRLPAVESAALGLVVDLVVPEAVDRLPGSAEVELLGRMLPLLRLAPFEASAPAKLRLAARISPADIVT